MKIVYNKLRGRIKEKFYSESNFAESTKLMAKSRLSLKLNGKVPFSHREMIRIMGYIGEPLDKAGEYFFSVESE